MGNNSSQGKPTIMLKNWMFVQTQNQFYYPGDQVFGTVYINVVEAFNCDGLNLAVCL